MCNAELRDHEHEVVKAFYEEQMMQKMVRRPSKQQQQHELQQQQLQQQQNSQNQTQQGKTTIQPAATASGEALASGKLCTRFSAKNGKPLK